MVSTAIMTHNLYIQIILLYSYIRNTVRGAIITYVRHHLFLKYSNTYIQTPIHTQPSHIRKRRVVCSNRFSVGHTHRRIHHHALSAGDWLCGLLSAVDDEAQCGRSPAVHHQPNEIAVPEWGHGLRVRKARKHAPRPGWIPAKGVGGIAGVSCIDVAQRQAKGKILGSAA